MGEREEGGWVYGVRGGGGDEGGGGGLNVREDW